jgi:hypothetical protein
MGNRKFLALGGTFRRANKPDSIEFFGKAAPHICSVEAFVKCDCSARLRGLGLSLTATHNPYWAGRLATP